MNAASLPKTMSMSMEMHHEASDQADGHAPAPPSVGVMGREEAIDRLVRMRERLRTSLTRSDLPRLVDRTVHDGRQLDLSFLPAAAAHGHGRDALDLEAITTALIALCQPTGGAQ